MDDDGGIRQSLLFDKLHRRFENLLPDPVEADPIDHVTESLLFHAVLTIVLNGTFDQRQHLRLRFDERFQYRGEAGNLAHRAAHQHRVATPGRDPRACRAHRGADAAIDASLLVDPVPESRAVALFLDLALDHVQRAEREAVAAVMAGVTMPLRLHDPADADVVLVGFGAVMSAAGDGNLELRWRFPLEVALVEVAGKLLGIDDAPLAGLRAGAGKDTPDAWPAGAHLHARFGKREFGIFENILVNMMNLNTLPGGEVHDPFAIPLGHLGYRGKLKGTEISRKRFEAHHIQLRLRLLHHPDPVGRRPFHVVYLF